MCPFHECNYNGFGDMWWTDKCTYFSSTDNLLLLFSSPFCFVSLDLDGGGDRCLADADLFSDTSSATGDSVSGLSIGSHRSNMSGSQRSTTSSRMTG